MRVKHLELRAKMVVEGFMSGLHRSPYHGFSVEFTDYRPYSPGDDLRYLDWKLLARQDRQYIKRFEDETNLRCYLLLDSSRSMGFSRGTIPKLEYAKTLAATLAWFFNRQRDAVGLLTFDEEILQAVPPRFRPGHLRRLMLALEQAQPGQATNLQAPLEQIARNVSKRGMVFLISDLLAPAEPLQQHLSYLKARGHEVVLLRVLDPAEVEFEFTEASMFRDLETGRQIYIEPQAARANYQREFAAHAEQLSSICQTLGIDLFSLRTDAPLEDFLWALLQSRAMSSGGARTRSPHSAGGRR